MEPLPVASLMGQSIIPDLESITVDIIGIYFVYVSSMLVLVSTFDLGYNLALY